jgi:hypothetical protein
VEILRQYQLGRPIQWGAFTSVTTSLAAAKGFAPQSRVVFKIAVTVREPSCRRVLPSSLPATFAQLVVWGDCGR